jgi:hypothetical protein
VVKDAVGLDPLFIFALTLTLGQQAGQIVELEALDE